MIQKKQLQVLKMEQLKNERFLIMKNVKNFILGLENLLVTFPKKDTFSKDRVYNEALELIEYITLANYEKRKDMKTTYQIMALGKINKLDFYLERAYKLKYISERQLTTKANELAKINKMIYAWCKNEG